MNKSIYTIIIPEIKIFAYHGCYEQEKRDGQEFEINMNISFHKSNAIHLDNLIKSSKPNIPDKSTFGTSFISIITGLSLGIRLKDLISFSTDPKNNDPFSLRILILL